VPSRKNTVSEGSARHWHTNRQLRVGWRPDLTSTFHPGDKNPAVEAAPSLERLGVDYVDRYSGLASNPDQD
jgi:hypothetical protein